MGPCHSEITTERRELPHLVALNLHTNCLRWGHHRGLFLRDVLFQCARNANKFRRLVELLGSHHALLVNAQTIALT